MNPTPIQISIDGVEITIDQIPGIFTLFDVMILIVSSFVLGISTMYFVIYSLFFDSSENTENSTENHAGELILQERKDKWEQIMTDLKNDEHTVYKEIIDSDGIINQSELPEKAGISKSRVSRALDLLESKGLVERRRRGMGNVVMLK